MSGFHISRSSMLYGLHMITLSALSNPFIASETHFPQSKSSICIAQHELDVHSTSKSIPHGFLIRSAPERNLDAWIDVCTPLLFGTLACFFSHLESTYCFPIQNLLTKNQKFSSSIGSGAPRVKFWMRI